MTEPTLDVLAIGNAIMDVIADADDAFLEREGMRPGSMRLIDAKFAVELYDRMGPGREISGGAAANTLAGLASLGANVGVATGVPTLSFIAPDDLVSGQNADHNYEIFSVKVQ